MSPPLPDLLPDLVLPALLARSALPAVLLALGGWPRRRAGCSLFLVLAEFACLELLALGLPAAAWLPLGLGYLLLLMIDQGLYRRLGWPLDAQALRFARREPANVRLLLRQEFNRQDAMVLGAGLAAALPALGAPPALPAGWALWGLLPALGLLGLAARRSPRWPPAPNLLRAIWQSRRAAPQGPGLGAAQREPLAGAQPPAPGTPQRPDVLLLVIESLSRRVLDSPAGRAATPRYQAFIEGESQAGRACLAQQALASSTSSDIAYACLFSGLSPEHSHERFHRQPLLWDVARAQGYHTALYSSQSLDWCGLDKFLLSPGPDRAVYREALGAPLFNDLAMDDRLLNRRIAAELPAAGRPFFAVVNYNMLHAPFCPGWDGQARADAPALQRYLDALRLFDQCFGELLDSLDAAGRLEHTVIALCADHGESPERYDRQQARRLPLRLDQFDLDGLHIPLWLRCPPATLTPAQRAHLQSHCAQQTVASLDLYPTLLELFGLPAARRQALASGHSLLGPLPAERSLQMHNTGAFRQWACEPFALARGHSLLMYHDLQRRFELRDLRQPEGPDQWPTLPAEARTAWLAELAGHPLMADILARRGLIKPPASSEAIAAEYDRLAGQAAGTDLHKLNNWGLFSLADWQALCHAGADFIGLRPGDRVFEAGCGAGAFLAVLRERGAAVTDGIDLSPGLIEVARRNLPGRFHVGDIQDLSCAGDARYDRVVAHGVFLYLPSLAACERAALEMIRLTRPGGLVYIGLLNDPERLAGYHSPHRPSGNAFVRRGFWHALGERLGLAVETIDQERLFSKAEGYDAHARLRYSVRLIKPATAPG